MNILFKKVPILIFMIWTHAIIAHPGIGFVKDSKGNLYYTDLKQIWKQTLEGKLSVAVPNVHSHELCIDVEDKIYGEHLWYVSAIDKFLHYSWCLLPDGTFKIVKATDTAYIKSKDYSYVRDPNGSMYWYEQLTPDSFQFIKSDSAFNKTVLASGKFKSIRWMFCSPESEIYFLDGEDLYKITSGGSFQTIAKNLAQTDILSTITDKGHNVFGIWFDEYRNVYAAITSNHCVKRISPEGEISTVYISKSGSPVGGLFDSEGNMWILETVGLYDVRIVKSHVKSLKESSAWIRNDDVIIIFLFICIALLCLYVVRKK